MIDFEKSVVGAGWFVAGAPESGTVVLGASTVFELHEALAANAKRSGASTKDRK